MSRDLLSVLFFAATSAVALAAPLQIVTTVPDVAQVVSRIGGAHVEVQSLLDGSEDPHAVIASPSHVSRLLQADAVCAVGLELEASWLPSALKRSGRKSIQRGGAGFCELAASVVVIGRDSHADHHDGHHSSAHAHSAGNPHFNLSPFALAEGSRSIVKVLSGLRPEARAEFEKRGQAFESEMRALVKSLKAELSARPPGALFEFHQEFAYFLEAYGLKSLGSVEERAGVSPSPSRLAQLSRKMRAPGSAILASTTSPSKPLDRLREATGIRVIKLPTWQHAQDPTLNTIEKLQRKLISELTAQMISTPGVQ